MIAAGCSSIMSIERLSVMGLVAPLLRIGSLLADQRRLIRCFSELRPRLFIGIDAPDFNLSIAEALYSQGISTAHCVSPSVWGWRQGRMAKIARSLDLMLTLFPFETEIYHQHGVPVRCIGHPLASKLAPVADVAALRRQLGLPEGKRLVAVLPGSRLQEVRRMGKLFAQTAQWCHAREPDLHFVFAAADSRCADILARFIDGTRQRNTNISIDLITSKTQSVLAAADMALITLGTATLEAMLIGKPMVTAWQTDSLSYSILKLLVKARWKSLPNLLAGEQLVAEMIQFAASPATLGEKLLNIDEQTEQKTLRRFKTLSDSLRLGGMSGAAKALQPMLQGSAGILH